MMVNQVMSEQIIKEEVISHLLPLTSYLLPLRVENVKHAKLELIILQRYIRITK